VYVTFISSAGSSYHGPCGSKGPSLTPSSIHSEF
ncbi:hypothetical protein A2U01_0116980, partial [Trifolium medium]|nr:hypothetical protein [Trifolium medium]